MSFSKCLSRQLHTPIALILPSLYRHSISYHISSKKSGYGQCIRSKSKYSVCRDFNDLSIFSRTTRCTAPSPCIRGGGGMSSRNRFLYLTHHLDYMEGIIHHLISILKINHSSSLTSYDAKTSNYPPDLFHYSNYPQYRTIYILHCKHFVLHYKGFVHSSDKFPFRLQEYEHHLKEYNSFSFMHNLKFEHSK